MMKAIRTLAVPLFVGVATCSFHASPHAQQKLRGWQFIAETESGIRQYIDMDALKKERGFVRVRTLTDYRKPVWSVTSKRVYSEVDERLVDCSNRRSALLAAAAYECRMANCAPKEDYKYSAQTPEFEPIAKTESLGSNLYSLVCQK